MKEYEEDLVKKYEEDLVKKNEKDPVKNNVEDLVKKYEKDLKENHLTDSVMACLKKEDHMNILQLDSDSAKEIDEVIIRALLKG